MRRDIISEQRTDKFQLDSIRHIIAVASGKGGVGKSTISINLALALSASGAKVGLLDADIYGPSQGMMLGLSADARPDIKNDHLLPIKAHGLLCMSMSFVASERTPAIWRGPMASGAMQQLLVQTDWGELDYLIVDMPPGTGDIQLTLSQRVPLAGALIVTTPQDIALLDATKGIEMFRRVEVPVLGIIENMSTHICSHCGHEERIFGAGGGAKVAETYQTHLLAQLPLDLELRQASDRGHPLVQSSPGAEISQRFIEVAEKVVEEIDNQRQSAPVINVFDD